MSPGSSITYLLTHGHRKVKPRTDHVLLAIVENGTFSNYREGENVSKQSVLRNFWPKIVRNDKNNATLKQVQPKFSPVLGENDGKLISTWNLDIKYVRIK